MRMGFGQSHSLSYRMLCGYCDRDIESHSSDCPLGHIAELTRRIEALESAGAFVLGCPKCSEEALALSEADFWQCYSCDVVMTSQGVGHNESDENHIIDHWRMDDCQLVRVIPGAKLRPRMYERMFLEIVGCRKKIKKIRKKMRKEGFDNE